jgi:PIN domain nuclease of toxin-antitoxin system
MDVEDWLDHVSAMPGMRFVPVDSPHRVQSVQLPQPFHQDPADRIIVSTARGLNLPLVTADQNIRDYNHVKTIW